MNKDKIAMFALIIGTLIFFQSPVGDSLVAKFFPAKNVPVQTKGAVKDKGEALLSAAATPASTKLAGEESPEPVAPATSAVITPAVTKDATAPTTADSLAVATPVTPVAPAKPDTTVIQNDRLILTVAGDGARIISAKLKTYMYAKEMKKGDKVPVELVANPKYGFAGAAINNKSLNNVIFKYSGNVNGSFVFVGSVDGQPVTKSFRLTEGSYVVAYQLESPLLVNSPATILFSSGINESESKNNWGLTRTPRLLTIKSGKDLEKLNNKFGHKSMSGRFDWVTMSSGYFAVAAIPTPLRDGSIEALSERVSPEEKDKAGNLIYSFSHTSQAVSGKSNYNIYIGPTRIDDLKGLGIGLDKTVFSGWKLFFAANLWFPPICEFTLWLMNIFFAIFHDYGVAIILITVILRLITFPLTQSSMKSMSRMRDMQPKLQEIQAKYKSNPQMLQAKMIELYRDEGVNPLSSLGGCIPMLLQMPIMIAVYNVVSKAIELRGKSTVLVPWIHDLSQKEALINLPFSIPVPFTSGYDTIALLPLIMAVLMFVQTKMSMKTAPGTTQDPNQLMMLYMMPFMMFFMFYNMPAGLTLYFTFSSVLQIIQQFFVDRKKSKTASSVTVVK